MSKEALAQPETPYEIGQRIAKTGGGISHLWSAVSQDGEIAEAERGFKEALAQPEQCEYPRCACDNKESCKQKAQPEQDNTYVYASSLATAIWQKHYMKESPKFALLDTTDGVLTQIDNMTCGLVREKPAQPVQEPVGKFAKFTDGIWREVTDGSAGVPLYTTPPQRTWVGLTDDERKDIELGIEVFAMSVEDILKETEAKLKEKNT